MPTIRISRDLIREAMQAQPVRDALARKADEIAAEVQAEDDEFYTETADMYDMDVPELGVEVSEGTRPGGRPYARVAVDKVDEWGDYAKPKRRILGRLAAKHNHPRGG